EGTADRPGLDVRGSDVRRPSPFTATMDPPPRRIPTRAHRRGLDRRLVLAARLSLRRRFGSAVVGARRENGDDERDERDERFLAGLHTFTLPRRASIVNRAFHGPRIANGRSSRNRSTERTSTNSVESSRSRVRIWIQHPCFGTCAPMTVARLHVA